MNEDLEEFGLEEAPKEAPEDAAKFRYRCRGSAAASRESPGCNYKAAKKWNPPCPGCGRWYNCVPIKGADVDHEKQTLAFAAHTKPRPRILTGVEAFDKVLGAGPMASPGIPVGACVLLGGRRGLGKSSLLLQAVVGCGKHVLWASGEQTRRDIFEYAQRLGIATDAAANVIILGSDEEKSSDAQYVVERAEEEKTQLLIIDSLMTIYDKSSDAAAGKRTQAEEVTQLITSFGKQKNCASILTCHVNAMGELSGGQQVQHLVDTLCFLDKFEPRTEEEAEAAASIDNLDAIRELRIHEKNRHGDANAREFLEMTPTGLKPLSRKLSRLIVIPGGRT